MIKVIHSYEEFKREVGQGKVLVDFFATWCGPCKMVAPIVDEIAAENDDVTVLSVDVDQVGEAAADFNVASIPTIIYFENGKPLRTQIGYAPKQRLLALIGK